MPKLHSVVFDIASSSAGSAPRRSAPALLGIQSTCRVNFEVYPKRVIGSNCFTRPLRNDLPDYCTFYTGLDVFTFSWKQSSALRGKAVFKILFITDGRHLLSPGRSF